MRAFLLSFLIASQAAFGVTANKVWRVPNGGTLPSWGAVNLASSSAVTGQLPKANLPTLSAQTSSSSGTFTTSSSSYVDVTNLSISLTTTGRPVLLFLGGNDSTSRVWGTGTSIGGSTYEFYGIVKLLRDSTPIAEFVLDCSNTATSEAGISCTWPPGSFLVMDIPSAGTYTYKWQAKAPLAAGSVKFTAVTLSGIEL